MGAEPRFTLGQLWPVLLVGAAVVASFTITQYTADANDARITVIEAAQVAQTAELGQVKTAVDRNSAQIAQQAQGINWIGQALEKLAEKQEVRLPARPIVSEAGAPPASVAVRPPDPSRPGG